MLTLASASATVSSTVATLRLREAYSNPPSSPTGAARPSVAFISRETHPAAESESMAVNGSAVGCPGEGVRPSFSLTGTKETAP